MIRGRESLYRKQPNRARGLLQDSLGSVTIADVAAENIKLENVPEELGLFKLLWTCLQRNFFKAEYNIISTQVNVKIVCMSFRQQQQFYVTYVNNILLLKVNRNNNLKNYVKRLFQSQF